MEKYEFVEYIGACAIISEIIYYNTVGIDED